MNTDLLKYFQQDGIGKVLAKGLADVYTQKPNAPVKYLAQWLKKYSKNQQIIIQLGKEQKVKKSNQIVYNQNVQTEQKKVQQEHRKIQSHNKLIQDFKNNVTYSEYHEQLLTEYLPQFLEKQFNLTGAYIGYIDHPTKNISDEDEDQNAHLNTSVPKLINYIGSSKSHKDLMIGKTLSLDKGVTAAALNLSLSDPQPNQQGIVEQKDKYIYISNVVKNQNINYFRLPKLGSYISLPLIYNSYLNEEIFDAALASRIKYLHQLQQFNKRKEEELKELQTQKASLQHKLAELVQKNNDQSAIEAARNDLNDHIKKIHAKEGQQCQQQHAELPLQKRQFLICGDTLGFDNQISQNNRQRLLQLAKHFRDCWQNTQKALLLKDIQYQINISKNLDMKPEAVIEHLQNKIAISAEERSAYDDIDDQNIREYRKSQYQLKQLINELRNSAIYLSCFFKLKNFRVVKYKQLIQTILHFLKFKKQVINLPKKTILNWKKIRATHINAVTFFAVIDYQTEGPKNAQYPHYCKIQYILSKLEKYNQADIFNYNIGLGAIVHLIKKQLAHRVANIQMRRQEKQNQRKKRQQLLQENEKITEQKRQALDKHKQTLIGEDLQAFKQEEWSAKYDQEFPLKQIPAEIIDDVDNDF